MNKENGHSALIAITDNGGRPTKYEPETVDRLLVALADRLTQKQACYGCSGFLGALYNACFFLFSGSLARTRPVSVGVSTRT